MVGYSPTRYPFFSSSHHFKRQHAVLSVWSRIRPPHHLGVWIWLLVSFLTCPDICLVAWLAKLVGLLVWLSLLHLVGALPACAAI